MGLSEHHIGNIGQEKALIIVDTGGFCISPRNEYTVSGGYAKNPSIPLALVVMILTQAVVGLLLVTVFVRTRSLLSGVVLHTILDTFSNLIR
jgi:hypothetical protein